MKQFIENESKDVQFMYEKKIFSLYKSHQTDRKIGEQQAFS